LKFEIFDLNSTVDQRISNLKSNISNLPMRRAPLITSTASRIKWILTRICASIAIISILLIGTEIESQTQAPDYKNPNLPIERRVADLLSRMTLEEKVAQLVCLWAERPQVGPQTDFSKDRGDLSLEKA
jgi:hypothetical protein